MSGGTVANELRVRPSIQELQRRYDKGDKGPLEDLIRAWQGIQALPPNDPNSFFVIGGYHGEPFQFRKEVDALSDTDRYEYWGGWCNHGNVLFPTWHRAYVLRIEDALRTIVPTVTMPYWDESSDDSLTEGIPSILTQEEFELDGKIIANPLRSFRLPVALEDFANDEHAYDKPAGYETVRYPLSGLVGTAEARQASEAHNAKYPDPIVNTADLNANVIAWMNGPFPTTPKGRSKTGTQALFEACLEAPNYTVFSNTTSAAEWNRDHPGTVVSVEAPHNDLHLAVGGFDSKPIDPNPADSRFEAGLIAEANGDMGENNTAGLDPIFFFHHCNIDRMFWLWQKRNDATKELVLLDGYAGTNSSDGGGPTPGVAPGVRLDMDSPLAPFMKSDGTTYTAADCVDIEGQLGYTYGPGSFDPEQDGAPPQALVANSAPRPSPFAGSKLRVGGIDRALFQGSFVVHGWALVAGSDGEAQSRYLGHYSVLSRRDVVRCANCLTHLEVVAYFPLSPLSEETHAHAEFHVVIDHRGEASLPGVEAEEDTDAGLAAGGTALLARPIRGALPGGLSMSLDVID
jgi:tyrosinase